VLGIVAGLTTPTTVQGKRAALEHLPPHTAGSPRKDSGSGGRRSSKASQGQPGQRAVPPPTPIVAAIAAQALHEGQDGDEATPAAAAAEAVVEAMDGAAAAAAATPATSAELRADQRPALQPAQRTGATAERPATHSGSSQHAIAVSVDMGDLSGQSTPERSADEHGAGATGGTSAPRQHTGRGTESLSPTPSPPPVLVRVQSRAQSISASRAGHRCSGMIARTEQLRVLLPLCLQHERRLRWAVSALAEHIAEQRKMLCAVPHVHLPRLTAESS